MTAIASTSLHEALRRYELIVPEPAASVLERYCRLLWEWNQKLNLTRHTTFDKFAARDLVDSLQLARLLDKGERVLDVGSGGGVPGVVLAVLRPDLKIALSESVRKRADVLRAIVADLDLPVAVFQDRAENVVPDVRFDALVARAVGPLWKMCKWFQPHWHCFGRLLAVKGPRWLQERKAARERGVLRHVELRRAAVYRMPDTNAESVILKLWQKTPKVQGEATRSGRGSPETRGSKR